MEFQNSFSGLLRKAVVSVLIAGTLVLVAYGGYSRQREELEVRENLGILSSFLASASQSFFDNIGNGMGPLGHLLEQRDVLHHPERVRPHLLEFRERYPEVTAMAVFEPDGRMLLNTVVKAGGALPDFRKDPPYLSQLLRDMANPAAYVVSPPEFGKAIRRWRFTIRHVVRDRQGHPLFLVQAAIPLERDGTFLHRLPVPASSHIGLLRGDGHEQARWPVADADAVYGRAAGNPMARAIQAKPGQESGFLDGGAMRFSNADDRIGAFTRLAGLDMYAYVSVPGDYVWQRWWRQNMPVFLAFAVFFGIFSVIAYWVGRRERSHSLELVSQARRDSLTGLPNRLAAEETLAWCIRMARAMRQRCAVLFVDIDRFKDVNDSYGHDVGDLLLQEVAEVIQGGLREGSFLSRLGGDEFLAILPACDQDAAALISQRLLDLFQEPLRVGERQLAVTPSIGVAIFPEHGEDIGTLLKHADTAMYEAKRQGRNAFSLYMDQLGERVRHRVHMEQALREAIKQGSFILDYQPVVDMGSGKLVGGEALVRWIDRDGRVIPPGEFIDIAEDSGLICPLGEWVLRSLCAQLTDWKKAAPDLWIAMNVSPRQFQDRKFIANIEYILRETGTDASRLVVEITETAAMENPEASLATMERLRAIGIRIAIDDFGTGYSSLSYLKRIPSDKIKIDKSFVSGIDIDAHDTGIVQTILALTAMLQKAAVAEGIETEAQFNALRELGCEYGQGYWISRPVPPDRFLSLVTRNEPLVARAGIAL